MDFCTKKLFSASNPILWRKKMRHFLNANALTSYKHKGYVLNEKAPNFQHTLNLVLNRNRWISSTSTWFNYAEHTSTVLNGIRITNYMFVITFSLIRCFHRAYPLFHQHNRVYLIVKQFCRRLFVNSTTRQKLVCMCVYRIRRTKSREKIEHNKKVRWKNYANNCDKHCMNETSQHSK